MALYGDKIYFGTSDVHVVALDARTGAVVWDVPITEPGSGFGLSGGPLVARGKVMQGVNGQAPGGAYIVALDAQTGAEAWRFYTIARPGEPGGESWNGLPLEQRTGGSVWTAGSYDAERNLAFFGPAPTYDTGPLRDPAAQRGVTNEALYTNATIALNPDTGALVWHFQHVPNDQWDFDWAFERQLVKLRIDGRERNVLVTAGKEAIYDALDLDDGGRYLVLARSRAAELHHGDRSTHGREDDRPEASAVAREPDRRVSPRGRREELGAGVDQSGDQGSFRAARRIVHGSDAGAAGATRLVVDGCPLDDSAAARQRRALRPHSGNRSHHAQDAVDRTATRPANDGRARDGRRARIRRRARPLAHGLRRRDGQSIMAREIERRAELGTDQLCRRRHSSISR